MSQPADALPQILSSQLPSSRKLTPRQLLLHVALFVATAITTTISGIIWCAGPLAEPAGAPAQSDGVADSILLLPWYYLTGIAELAWQALTHPALLVPGLALSGW